MDNKSAVGYMHKPATEYICGDCIFYLDDKKRCQLLGSDVVLVYDGCNNFCPGTPGSISASGDPLFILNPNEVGLTHSEYGFSCKRCVHFDGKNWACDEVDRSSEGDDPGMIHPDACCNEWEPDPLKGHLPTEAVRAVVNPSEVTSESY